MSMHDFRKLNIWKNSMELVTVIYKVTGGFPKSEVYGLTNQIRRSVVSISSNIAEGSGRMSDAEFKKYLYYSYGSCCELETQLIIANNIGYLSEPDFKINMRTIQVLEKMIFKLIESLL